MIGPPVPASDKSQLRIERSSATAYRFGRTVSLLVSVALHAPLLYLIGALPWTIIDPASGRPINIVWKIEQETPPTTPPPSTDIEVPPPVETAPPEPPEITPEERPPPEPAPEPEPEPITEAEAQAEPDAGPEPSSSSSEATSDTAPEATDESHSLSISALEEARREVLADMRRQQEIEAGYRTFSMDDWIVDQPRIDTARSEPRVEPWPPCPLVTRRAVQIAMAMAGVCFRTRARSDLFSHLTPNLTNWRPVCEVVIDGNGDEVYKCQVVVDD